MFNIFHHLFHNFISNPAPFALIITITLVLPFAYKLLYTKLDINCNVPSFIFFAVNAIIFFFFIINIIFISNLSSIETSSCLLFTPFFFPLPSNLRLLLEKYTNFRQTLYNNITIKLLETFFFRNFIIFIHQFLFLFRIYSVKISEYIEHYIPLNIFFILISVIASRLHFAGYFIVFCLLFLRLDMAVIFMSRFYQKYPHMLNEIFTPKRNMWSSATKIAQEAALNPKVQAVTAGVVGALAWKALDIHDIYVQKEISEYEIQAENQRHKEEMVMRQAELEETKAARIDENQRHKEEMAIRQAELEETKTARIAENQRHKELEDSK